jgi:hypothetical protein
MEFFNFDNLNVTPLNEVEMQEYNGGIVLTIIGLFVGFIIGAGMVIN